MLKVTQLLPSTGLFRNLRREVALTCLAIHCYVACAVGELCPVVLPDFQEGPAYLFVGTIS